MLMVNQLDGFGGYVTATTTYRYFKLDVTNNDGGTYLQIGELKLYVGAVKYPTSSMTGDSAPAPLVATYSDTLGANYHSWRAFDDTALGGGFLYSNNGGATGWIKVDLGSGNGILPTSFKITGSDTANRSPKDFTLQGSNDDAAYTTLKTVTGETGWGVSEERTFTI